MKATFALPADPHVHNAVQALRWEIHQKYRTGTGICRLPPHVSLKQPFDVADLPALADYMDTLAGRLAPVDIVLTELQMIPTEMDGMETGILWWDVEENTELRKAHEQINRDLTERFDGEVCAEHDGPEYRFHTTVMLGGQPREIYRRCFEDLAGRKRPLCYTATELALFLYEEPLTLTGDYLTYKVLPLRG